MAAKITISLDESLIEFIDQRTNNRSKFISELLSQLKQKEFEAELEKAYIDQENDPEFQQEIAAWDCVVGDGLNA
ncbi:hypothetical protein [Pleurocapsa sp. PCC 7319]|uniref:type II toxin-antitoxin system MazE family antitoxin n=1 Tax=Pleurocapsa sp. PCC 7319 TaxID=118161 RepID=UPI0003469358|nr:hypothetical protein [Pleurocapsa sp. PCC 7319]